MKVQNFIDDFKSKKVKNTQIAPNAVSEYIKKTLEVKETLSFMEKRVLAETVVNENTKEVDGVLKHDSISAYVSFVIGTIAAHTNLEFGDDPIADYDLLIENGLLMPIIDTFREDYTECDVLLKMALSDKLSDNNINVFMGKFLNGILNRLDAVGEVLKDKLGDINLKDILGANFKEEDIAKLSGFLDTYKK